MASKKLVVIGLGGIGSVLCDNLCRYLNFKKDEHWNVCLVDGDSYELKNQERQSFVRLGNKARVKSTELRMKFENVTFDEYTEYITKSNVGSVISEGDIVLICVDNHKTRKIISDYINGMNDIVVISGGNEKFDGNVQITLKKGGKFESANLVDYHPEIDNPDDKSPDEMSCEELSSVEPQIIFTNMTAATIMCCAFYSLNENLLDINSTGEVYFDIIRLSMIPHARRPRN